VSWLSDRLGTTGKTPAFIRNLGNVAGSAVTRALPFGLGDPLDKVFNLTGTQPDTGGVSGAMATTGQNLNNQLTEAQALQSAQRNLPMLLLIGAVLFLLFRRR
jgi:hypothetical protein